MRARGLFRLTSFARRPRLSMVTHLDPDLRSQTNKTRESIAMHKPSPCLLCRLQSWLPRLAWPCQQGSRAAAADPQDRYSESDPPSRTPSQSRAASLAAPHQYGCSLHTCTERRSTCSRPASAAIHVSRVGTSSARLSARHGEQRKEIHDEGDRGSAAVRETRGESHEEGRWMAWHVAVGGPSPPIAPPSGLT
jgi:hypothetical protein